MNVKKIPDYYVIVKDVRIINNDNVPTFGSGPVEVLTNKNKAIEHLAKLNKIAPELSEYIKKNEKNAKEAKIEFRLEFLDKECNQTVTELIKAFEEGEEDENDKGSGES